MRQSTALLWLPLLLASWFGGNESLLVQQSLSPKKQRQKIAVLQKKLESAEKEQKKIETDVEKIAREIDEAQIALIRRQLDEYENRAHNKASLFVEEREALYRMIQSGPSPSAFEAQVELDRILRLITEFSDGEKTIF